MAYPHPQSMAFGTPEDRARRAFWQRVSPAMITAERMGDFVGPPELQPPPPGTFGIIQPPGAPALPGLTPLPPLGALPSPRDNWMDTTAFAPAPQPTPAMPAMPGTEATATPTAMPPMEAQPDAAGTVTPEARKMALERLAHLSGQPPRGMPEPRQFGPYTFGATLSDAVASGIDAYQRAKEMRELQDIANSPEALVEQGYDIDTVNKVRGWRTERLDRHLLRRDALNEFATVAKKVEDRLRAEGHPIDAYTAMAGLGAFSFQTDGILGSAARLFEDLGKLKRGATTYEDVYDALERNIVFEDQALGHEMRSAMIGVMAAQLYSETGAQINLREMEVMKTRFGTNPTGNALQVFKQADKMDREIRAVVQGKYDAVRQFADRGLIPQSMADEWKPPLWRDVMGGWSERREADTQSAAGGVDTWIKQAEAGTLDVDSLSPAQARQVLDRLGVE